MVFFPIISIGNNHLEFSIANINMKHENIKTKFKPIGPQQNEREVRIFQHYFVF